MENWKDIPGYEGLYQASNLGRIRTCEGKITCNARFKKRVWKQRILKQKVTTHKNGRRDARICLWKDGKEKTWLVARLIAMAWSEGYAPNLTVNHIDGDTLNNKSENLEWVSLADNIRHAVKNGIYKHKIPIFLKNERHQIRFESMAEASGFLGRNYGYVSNRIKKGLNVVDLYTGEAYDVIFAN